MTAADLADYEVKVRKPITGIYRGYTIVSTPPASSGGTHVIQILNILENIDMPSTATAPPRPTTPGSRRSGSPSRTAASTWPTPISSRFRSPG